MPARVSPYASTAAGVSRKSSAQTPRSRRTTAVEIVRDEGPSTRLRVKVCEILGDAQRSTAGHRKLAVTLRKIQERCCYKSIDRTAKGAIDFEENDFNVEVARCVLRLMSVKRSERVGDCTLKFLGLFLRLASDKDVAMVSQTEVEASQVFLETPTTRLVSHILSILLPLLQSKEKTVRYRATQSVAHIVNSLDSIDDEYYHLLRTSLLKRIRDKEPMIRVQAVLGLGRLAGNEDDQEQEDADSDSENSHGLLERLLDVLQNDSSADVRRSLLLNLPLTPGTLPFLLERARDLDSATRRALYSRLLPALGDFRHLSLSMREKLLRWGLRDRDGNVQKATGRLFRERWIEDCSGESNTKDGQPQAAPKDPSFESLLELLERIDVLNSATSSGIALEAMKDFWNGRPDYRDSVDFSEHFWSHLTPESVFMARSWIDFCKGEGIDKYETLIEDKMPEVTKFGFFLQQYTIDLINRLRRTSTEGAEELEEDTVEQEFIVEQLLHIAKTLDYTDEVGRRKMFALLRETLSVAELPDDITRLVVDVLRDVCGMDGSGEREFCSVVLEAVAEVHDTVAYEDSMICDGDESFHSARSEISEVTSTKSKTVKENKTDDGEAEEAKAIREIMVNMKCLHIAQCMLENVEGSLHQNVHLVTMLNNLVVPAVRSHEAPIRERGLLCLGLCCLLDKALADENLTLFLHCYNKGHDALQISAVHTLCDILTTHPTLLTSETGDPNLQKSINKIFTKAIRAAHMPDVQLAATTALCKLMLMSIIRDKDLLKQAVICYLEPSTKDNAGVIQALSYFLPVFCHSKRDNMEIMASIVGDVLHHQLSLADELEAENETISSGTVGNMLVDWTDARKLVVQDQASVGWDEAGRKEANAVNGDIHLSLAESLLEKSLTHNCTKEERKAMISMVGKMYITPVSSSDKLEAVRELVVEAIDSKIATDAASRNALSRLHVALSKAIGETGKGRQSNEDSDDKTAAEDVQETASIFNSGGNLGSEEAELEVNDIESATEDRDTTLEHMDDEENCLG
ncbi:MAG: hypothetical protein Q9190_006759 [Brigantiaea leucoxantha]